MFNKLVIIAAGYVLLGGTYEKGKQKGRSEAEKEIAVLMAKVNNGIASTYEKVLLEEFEKKGERYLGIR